MIENMIHDSTREQLDDFLREAMDYLRSNEPRVYEILTGLMYDCIYGLHFNEWSYRKAVGALKNRDGTNGAHWRLEELERLGIAFEGKDYNLYDFAFAINMIYSDYYGLVPDDVQTYRKMAVGFLEDADAPRGKAWLYHDAMKM